MLRKTSYGSGLGFRSKPTPSLPQKFKIKAPYTGLTQQTADAAIMLLIQPAKESFQTLGKAYLL